MSTRTRRLSFIAALASIALIVTAVAMTTPDTTTAQSTGELLFHSGFEADVYTIVPTTNPGDTLGTDHSVTPPNDWVADLEQNVGPFVNWYSMGDETMRYAKIATDPTNLSNRVLHYWLNEGSEAQGNGRISSLFQSTLGLQEHYVSERAYLPVDWRTLENYPDSFTFLTIMEFWNDHQARSDYPFRITLAIRKDTGVGMPFYWNLTAEDRDPTITDGSWPYTRIWEHSNRTVPIPIGTWFTLEYYYKEGDAQTGRFWLAITPDGGTRQVVFDINNYTHNTLDPSPDGLKDFEPMKLYTSLKLIDYMRSQGKVLQIYWDDFSIWKGVTPETAPSGGTTSSYTCPDWDSIPPAEWYDKLMSLEGAR